MAAEWLYKEAGRFVLRFGRRDETSLLLIERAAPASLLLCRRCSERSVTVAHFPDGEMTEVASLKLMVGFHVQV
jgi:hypothetical protein